MRLASSSPRPVFAIFFGLIVVAAIFSSSCGSGGSMPSPSGPQFSGNTQVTVVLTSTANDQLAQFYIQLQNLTLTSQSGQTVTLLSSPSLQQDYNFTELMHVNGGANPLLTLSIPQGVYTAAAATLGYAQFTCVTLSPQGSAAPGGIDSNTFAYGQTPTANVSVNLPSPITITGEGMGLSLDLLVSQSASYPNGCYTTGLEPFSITPTFNLTPLTLSSQPTNANNGEVVGLDGQITTIGTTANNLTLSLSLPFQEGSRAVSASVNSKTVYQGSISDFSSLAAGTFVDLDGAIQPDGSLLATRIEVLDPAAVNVQTGPLLQVAAEVPDITFYGVEQQGPSAANVIGAYDFSVADNAVFQISGQLPNLADLPFVPSFTASDMVAGQEVYLSTDAAFPVYSYPVANTITLIPQTINGTVMSSSTIGNFTDYAVALASYDLFPTFAVQQGQTTLLNNPSVVDVYVDGNTQLLNTQPLTSGSTLRFYGLVFNDNGALRMDCAQVNDGVALSTQPSASQQAHMVRGSVEQTLRKGASSLQQSISGFTRQP
jgi:hypothetical protein